MQLTIAQKKLRAWFKANPDPGEAPRTQTRLAKELEVTQSAVSLWLKEGHRPDPFYRKILEKKGICLEVEWLYKKERALLDRLEAQP